MAKERILESLAKHSGFGFSIGNKVLKRIKNYYEEKHRHYHTWEHVEKIVDSLLKDEDFLLLNKRRQDNIIVAAIFHDVIYDVMNPDNNEVKSCDVYLNEIKIDTQNEDHKDVIKAIMLTREKNLTVEAASHYTSLLWKYDNQITYSTNIVELLEWERGIFKEYSIYPYWMYRQNRLKFLSSIMDRNPVGLKMLYDYVENFVPKIGIYAGSFNPFHLGHLNIIQKAEHLFDKIVVAQGQNPTKRDENIKRNHEELNMSPDFHYETLIFYSALDSLIKDHESQGADVTLIRGLRDGKDLSYEMTQEFFVKGMKPDIKVVYITCDAEFQYISSSAIRQLDSIPGCKHEVSKYVLNF